mgnify:CR=1 FL=1
MLKVVLLTALLLGCGSLGYRFEPCIGGVENKTYKDYVQGDSSNDFVTEEIECKYDDTGRPSLVSYKDYLEGVAERDYVIETKTFSYSDTNVVITTRNYNLGFPDSDFVVELEIIKLKE